MALLALSAETIALEKRAFASMFLQAVQIQMQCALACIDVSMAALIPEHRRHTSHEQNPSQRTDSPLIALAHFTHRLDIVEK